MITNVEQKPQLSLMRDFYFSTVIQKLERDSMGLLNEVENTDLKRRLELFKLTIEDEETFSQIINDMTSGNDTLQNIVHGYHKDKGLTDLSDKNKDTAFFRVLLNKVAEPTAIDLIKNRLIKLLDDEYAVLEEGDLKKEFISMVNMYVVESEEDVADRDTLLEINNLSLWSMNNRYHLSEGYKEFLSDSSHAIQAQAIQEHNDNRGGIIVTPYPFSSERLAGLKIN